MLIQLFLLDSSYLLHLIQARYIPTGLASSQHTRRARSRRRAMSILINATIVRQPGLSNSFVRRPSSQPSSLSTSYPSYTIHDIPALTLSRIHPYHTVKRLFEIYPSKTPPPSDRRSSRSSQPPSTSFRCLHTTSRLRRFTSGRWARHTSQGRTERARSEPFAEESHRPTSMDACGFGDAARLRCGIDQLLPSLPFPFFPQPPL